MPDGDPQREIATETTPSAEGSPAVDTPLDAEEASVEDHGIRHRLAVFSYRGQLGPTIGEELQDFLIKRRRGR